MKHMLYGIFYIGLVCAVVWMVQASYRVGFAEGKGAAASEIKLADSKQCYNWWFTNDSKNSRAANSLRMKQTKELLCKSKT